MRSSDKIRFSSRKQEAEGIVSVATAAACLLLVPFVVLVPILQGRLKKSLNLSEADYQIMDFGRAAKLLAVVGLLLAFLLGIYAFYFVGIPMTAQRLIGIFPILLILVAGIAAAQIAAVQMVGVAFDPASGRMIFPADGQLRNLEDLFTMRWLTAPFSSDSIRLQDITSFSRQRGTILLLHGNFGSRQLQFSQKLKRDECIGALRRYAPRINTMDVDIEGS